MKVALVMPAYNEADGIIEFLDDIYENLSSYIDFIVIVDDFSTDSTSKKIVGYSKLSHKIKLYANDRNLGHGPTFVKAINHALLFDPEIIITVDGDGQFRASDIAEKLEKFKTVNFEILECCRINRSDPFFRKLVTFCLKLFVFVRVGRFPRDSNTPLRIYRTQALKGMVGQIPVGSLIPNIRFSALARRSGLKFAVAPIESIPRRGMSVVGSSWKSKKAWLPSSRFIIFCKNAIIEIWRFPI
jgi:dolichol-phosphate mannosyltransferase